MIIDAHAHACGVFLDANGILEILDLNKVDKVVLVPGEYGSTKNYSLPDIASRFPNTDVIKYTNMMTKIIIGISGTSKHIDKGNDYVFTLKQAFPDRIIQFYWHKLLKQGGVDLLERKFKECQFKGIKFHQCWESFKIDSEEFDVAAEWACSKDLPVFVHLYSKKSVFQMMSYLKNHPRTNFIIGHLFGLEHYIREGMDLENMFFEISTPQLISIERLKKAINYFGAQRVLFGSDTPYGLDNQKTNMERILSLNITQLEKEKILGHNMKQLLRL